MGFFNLSRDEQARIDAMPGTSEVPAPGALEGLLTAIPKGIVSGADKVGQLGNDLASSDAGYAFFNSPSPDELIAHIQNPQPDSEAYKQAAAGVKVATDWAATGQDPRVTGTVGRIASGTSEGLTIGLGGAAVAGPWGAAALLGSAEGYSGYKEAKAQGVDETTAREQGGLEGAFAAGSAFLPMKFGKTLAQSLIGGSLANVTLGAAQRGLTSEVLESNGYHEMAGQYRIADGEAVASDLILGAAFGAFGHATSRKVNPADVDAASAVAAEDHFNRSAPGVPTDPQTATLHADTMADAMRSLANGDMPDIPAERAQQLVENVVPDPAHEAMADLHEAAQAELPGFESAAADLKPIEMPPEEVPPPKVEPEPATGEPAKEPDVPLDDFHASMLDHLVHNYGDERYVTEDGREVSYRELANEMQKQRNEADSFAKLHDVAAACAARNGV
jgi:hypothetical protein